ncbi:hypothetical protein PQR53_32710 [Paraburkholderia fungorum]|uniref:hypothetical protein n=1 Tax=Paraburkholderia fungorum TaxID=134537 RepID=UPI0038BBD98D
MDEVLDSLGPAKLQLVQDLIDDVILQQQAAQSHPVAAGSPQPGTSSGGETRPAGQPELEGESPQLAADAQAIAQSLSDEQIAYILNLLDQGNIPDTENPHQ